MMKKLVYILVAAFVLMPVSSILAFEYDPDAVNWDAVDELEDGGNLQDVIRGSVRGSLSAEDLAVEVKPVRLNPNAVDIVVEEEVDLREVIGGLNRRPDVRDIVRLAPEREEDNFGKFYDALQEEEVVDDSGTVENSEVSSDHPPCSESLYGPEQFRCIGDFGFQLEGYFCHPHRNDGYVHCTLLDEEVKDPEIVEEEPAPSEEREVDEEDDPESEPEVVYPECGSAMRSYSEFYCERDGDFSLSGYDCHTHGDLHHCTVRRESSDVRDSGSNVVRKEVVYATQPSRAGSGAQRSTVREVESSYPRCGSGLRDFAEFYCVGSRSFSLSGYDCHNHDDLVHCTINSVQSNTQRVNEAVVNRSNSNVVNSYQSAVQSGGYESCGSVNKNLDEFYCQAMSFYLASHDCHKHGDDLFHCKKQNMQNVSSTNSGVISTSAPVVRSGQVASSKPDAPEGCHYHGDFLHCEEHSRSGNDVMVEGSFETSSPQVLVAPEDCEYFEGNLYCNYEQSRESAEVKEEVETEQLDMVLIKYGLIAVSILMGLVIVYLLTRKNER